MLPNTTRLGHYEILAALGAGGMGEVYRARDSRLDREVAIKVLPASFAKDAERMRRFVQEAKAASALNHPNILTIHEIGESDGTHYIATEYIEGQTLRHHIQLSRMKIREVLDAMVQVASAPATAHQAGIIHRDIKPENIMLRPDGIVKVLDFGLAKLSEKNTPTTDSDAATISRKATDPGTIMGTMQYMSPEQARGKLVDARTDIFSLGTVLYEMVAGRAPFAGESSTDVLAAILDKEPLPLARFVDEAPQELQRIVTKCLRKERDERYQTMKDVLLDLKELRDELALEAKLERSVRPVSNIENQQTLIADGEITKGLRTQATSTASAQTASSAEYLVSEIKNHKRGVVILLLGLLMATSGLGYWYFSTRSSNAKQIESIAVMPFVNESGNADLEYLSDGMTETLISSLSQLPNLSVKARSTVFYYKGKETSPKSIGEELPVQAILLGRVIQRGNDLKLSLELVNTQTQDVIWSEQYNRKQTDLVTLQTEIARDVSGKLKSKLSGADETKLTKSYTANPEAYQAYLKGRFYWNKRNGENLKKAIEEFKSAAEKDPNYALAYVGLADSYALLLEYAATHSSDSLPQARAFAQRAIEIDGLLGEAHTSLALINHKSWQWAVAEKEFKRAIELNPTYPTTHHWYSHYLRETGQVDKAFAEIKLAQELDPLSGAIGVNVGHLYLIKGDYDSAIRQIKQAMDMNPSWWIAYFWLGQAYARSGRNEEAISELKKSVALSNRTDPFALSALGCVYGITGKRNEALAILGELESKYAKQETNGMNIAAIHLGLGDKDKAFAWLEKDFQARNELLPRMIWNPSFDSLRDDPQYKDLLKRMGLPE